MQQEEINFTDFIASSIHDMKNSLNIQVSSLESIALECRQRGDQETFEKLGLMIYEANRMNANLIQLLSLYKFGQSSYPMDIVEQPVADVIEEAMLQNKTLMEFKGLEVSVDCDPDCYWYIDRDLVTGILVNALNNAYKYTDKKIRVAAQVVDRMLELRVEDDGRGYPPNMLHDGAVTAHKGINFFSGSTGLGFHFAARAAAMHKTSQGQGTLTIENGGHFGGGCFVVRLP
jgi:two-component system sensor histidine kinase SenX3